MTKTGALTVKVANGDNVSYTGRVPSLDININDDIFSTDCYAIPMDGYDIVLGVAFLRHLGPVLWDFEDLCLAFWKGPPGCSSMDWGPAA